jgi:hypothetical protein
VKLLARDRNIPELRGCRKLAFSLKLQKMGKTGKIKSQPVILSYTLQCITTKNTLAHMEWEVISTSCDKV